MFDTVSRVSARALRLASRWRREEKGVAAVEMAFIAPAALMLLGLTLVGGQGFSVQTKVALAARTVTDLVSQAPYVKDPLVAGATSLNKSDLDVDLALASEIMYPNSTTGLTAVVSELLVNSTLATGTVVWSEAYNGATALPVGTVLHLDSSIVQTGATYLIYGQVQYSFQPLGVYLPTSTIVLSGAQTLTPRNASQITINWAG